MTEITPDLLRKVLRYEPATGKLFWKERPPELFVGGIRCPVSRARKWNQRYAGTEAFLTSLKGYRMGRVFKQNMLAHRAAWAIHHGEWPPNDIDHINGVRTDNRIENLRAVTRSENLRNMKRSKRNKSGVTGVFWNAKYRRWLASIRLHGRSQHLGHFSRRDDAIAARKAAELEHGFHENHGRPQ